MVSARLARSLAAAKWRRADHKFQPSTAKVKPKQGQTKRAYPPIAQKPSPVTI
jgi:hypothetical protein